MSSASMKKPTIDRTHRKQKRKLFPSQKPKFYKFTRKLPSKLFISLLTVTENEKCRSIVPFVSASKEVAARHIVKEIIDRGLLDFDLFREICNDRNDMFEYPHEEICEKSNDGLKQCTNDRSGWSWRKKFGFLRLHLDNMFSIVDFLLYTTGIVYTLNDVQKLCAYFGVPGFGKTWNIDLVESEPETPPECWEVNNETL